jgi:hypothetical protein
VAQQPLRAFPPEDFRRQDEADDRLFYTEPRLLVHIDEPAIEVIGRYLGDQLPQNGVILDLLSSWRSHLPSDLPKQRLVGLGLNDVEMTENPQLDDYVVHDVNADPVLPFAGETFDAVLITVSIQYLVKPVEVFREVNRVLKPGGSFHVIYSNRMFPTKAVAIWQSLNDAQHGQLIGAYFALSNGWARPQAWNISPKLEQPSDPVYVVAAGKSDGGLIIPEQG